MKPLFAAIAIVLSTAPAGALAQTPPPLMEPLRIKHQEMPLYPQELIPLRVREGSARVAYSVDASGKVDDCLAVAYTRPEFARATEIALRLWTFEPARLRGIPVASTAEISVRYEVQGIIVVEQHISSQMDERLTSLEVLPPTYRAHELRELDRIPTPIVATPPAYPMSLMRQGHSGNVTIHFYIDESGAVRMPTADSSEDPELVPLAISAISQWKFEPPKCRGVPVLVRADQVFRFLKSKEPASAPAAGS
jgi:TonB family protein